MPIYIYVHKKCESEFEILVSIQTHVSSGSTPRRPRSILALVNYPTYR